MSAAITVAQLIEKLQQLDPDLEVWAEDGASESGYTPVVAASEGIDPDPAPGEPEQFAMIETER